MFGLDRFYMGFSGLGLLKLALLALSWALYASVGTYSLIVFVPFLVFFLVDYFWVLGPAVVGKSVVPFATQKHKGTWQVAATRRQSKAMQALAALSMVIGIAVVVILVVLL
jgi:TM2 domain-containing membrane protein YozV